MTTTENHLSFTRTVLAGGLLVLLPLSVVFFLVGKIVVAFRGVSQALVEKLPPEMIGELPMVAAFTALFMVLFCYILGRMVLRRDDMGKDSWLERKLLNKIHGYQLLKGLAQGFFGFDSSTAVRPALLRREKGIIEIVLVTEALDNDRYAVFMPESPAPMTGPMAIIDGELLEFLPVGAGGAAKVFTRWGGGTGELLAQVGKTGAD